jgi:serine/threonine protein phosphatase PrpC
VPVDKTLVPYPSPIRWTSAASSHVGLVRAINEDAYLDRPQRGLWAVADGMGGHDAGDLASRMVVSALDGLGNCTSLAHFVAQARDRLLAVNRQLRVEAIVRDVPLIGSTVVTLLAWERYCAYLWAGDSRIYLYRNGRLKLLSRDHSQVEELKSQGQFADEEPAHPRHNLITRAVGAIDSLELDEGTVLVADGDIFLLCSDGLSNQVGEQEIASALVAGNCQHASETLIDRALKGGGRDNITALVIRAEDLDSGDMTMLNPAL